MATRRSWRPRVEPLEERTVFSASSWLAAFITQPPAVHAAHPHRHHHHHSSPGSGTPGPTQQTLALTGSVTGSWQKRFVVPDVGGDQILMGSGTVGPLGAVQMTGELHTPGFVAQGHATATVTLSNADGSVTLQLVGPTQPGFSSPPPTFQYTITGGTGKYAGASGSGTASFQEQTAPPLVCPPNAMCVPLVSGTFTLTFQSATA